MLFKYMVVTLLLSSVSINAFPPYPRLKQCKKTLTTVSGPSAPKFLCSGELIFNEEFNTLDTKTWQHENTLSGGGNWEFQWYTNNRSNSYINNGKLFIKPTLTADKIGLENLSKMKLDINGFGPADYCTDQRYWGCVREGTKEHILNPIRSAKLTTVESFAFKYGKVEVRAKMPTGDWLWPAIWFLPRYEVYGPWPGSGTIVLANYRGNKNFTLNNVNIGVDQMESTLHWGPDVTHDGYPKTTYQKNRPGNGFNNKFELYQMEWTPEYLKFSINNEEIGIVKPETNFWDFGNFKSAGKDNPWINAKNKKLAPFDEEFYIIINLAIGGTTAFSDEAVNTFHKPWSNKSPTAATDFWDARKDWLPTWNLKQNKGDAAALQIDFVKIWAL